MRSEIVRCSTYHSTVPAVVVRISIIWFDDSCIARLQVLSSRRLDFYEGLFSALCASTVDAIQGHWSFAVVHCCYSCRYTLSVQDGSR